MNMMNFENFMGSIRGSKPEKLKEVNIDSAEALIERLTAILDEHGELTRNDVDDAKDMVLILEELQKDYASEKINVALTKLRHIRESATTEALQ